MPTCYLFRETIVLKHFTSFIVFSTILTLFPRFLLFMAEPSGGRSVLSPLESFLATQLGIAMGAVALTLVLTVRRDHMLSISISPMGRHSQIPNTSPTGFQHDEHVNSHPLLVPVTSASVLLAYMSYNKSGVGSLGSFIFLGSSFVGLFGLWVVRVFKDFIRSIRTRSGVSSFFLRGHL